MSEFSVPGVRLGVAQAGIKYEGRDDLTLIGRRGKFDGGGLYLKCVSRGTCGGRERNNASQDARYILINSGNANAVPASPAWTPVRRAAQRLPN